MGSALGENLREDNYRACVGIMLVNVHGDVFVGNRLDMKSVYWQMPQGGIEKGETPIEAMHRELKEETGISDIVVLSEVTDWLYYDLPDALKLRLWGGHYTGQRQKWFLCGFNGEDEDVNIGFSDAVEFGDWKWQDLNSIVEEVVPFKRDVYCRVVEEFSSQVEEWMKRSLSQEHMDKI